MTEMLLQSQNEELELLPALPLAWKNGSISGLRARGGFEVSLTWRDGKLETATIRNLRGGHTPVRYGEQVVALRTKRGAVTTLGPDLQVLRPRKP